ncbi:rod shape-determining protein [Candidatus Collierbacteria bacterium RIFCSPLOWO2_01_FULL_50_23]|uniref:Cell shape-determining protein MreB n=2 Tax=Candidatus Collieribacteriota TaxID=1752725 RepID=A0A1F5EST3_9BACT|nr:MAG: rod shape-determining protein [Candidatus Collierbacteria bacterium RIFCSPHIGHO2_02_FULL_49_10]OGD72408.1 MAG: rod shape-determining protein [Candidatus Collierbacteria bacterium RIFCSPHIGHO2_01_FULL_50_25]OGD74268.1 MAG: rod shape-determining protein [Candidatus Collierbacteria bacterium RIFCSPLOWO2_01_FULL_50_23]
MKFSLSKRVGIDLGTANCLVYVVGEGIVMEEPTVVAVSLTDSKVLAVGKEAEVMLGRTPGNIKASKPMRDGVIADYVVTEAMMRYFLRKVSATNQFFKPEVMVCVPAGVTQVERRAVLSATMSAGARVAYLIEEPLAAAIGAGIPIAEASGNMILDMGGGASEAAVISLGGVVTFKSVRVAGNKIDESISRYVRKKHNLVIGEITAEKIKVKIGSATNPLKEETLEVTGRDSVTGLPKSVVVTAGDVFEAISDPLGRIINMVKSVLEEVPPELSSDIIDKGIVMSGGTATLRNFDKLLTHETGVPAFVAEDPLRCVVKGTGVALENLELYRRSITTTK